MHDTGTYGRSNFSKNIYKYFEIEVPTKLYVLFISLPESLDIKKILRIKYSIRHYSCRLSRFLMVKN